MKLRPAYPEALNDLADVYLAQGKAAEAERTLIRAIEVDPRHEDSYVDLAKLYEQRHDLVAATKTYQSLLAVQPRAFVVTTESDHHLDVYLNLASRMTLTGINLLWVADITSVRLHAAFVYLAVILDACSRKVVGWALDQTLATRLPLGALRHAISTHQPPPGVVHHSDRGVQYASSDYVQVLREHQMIPSMSRPANPYDNASCESFIKTLKREEIAPTGTGILGTCAGTWSASSSSTIIASGCIPPWAIVRRRSLSTSWVRSSQPARPPWHISGPRPLSDQKE